MTSSLQNSIEALAEKIKGLIPSEVSDFLTQSDLTTHENKTGSSSQKGHVQAGGTPQTIGTSLSAGTDNGYYARADHVHTIDYDNINNKPSTFTPSAHTHDYISTTNSSVGTNNVADKAITNAKIADSTIESGKIKDGTIVNADISESADIAQTKINGLVNSLTSKNVTVEKLSTAENGSVHSYAVKQNGVQVGATINIPRDFLVRSGTLKTATSTDLNTLGDGYEVGDKYIDFVINTPDSSPSDEAYEHIYINVKDLIDTYTADESTITKSSNNQFSLKDSSNYVKKSSTSGYIKNDGSIGTPTNTTYSADESTITKSLNNQFSLKDSSDYVKKSSTSGYIKNDGSIGTPTNTYDRMIYGSQIKAGEDLTANTLIYAKTDGKYYKIASGGTLDIRYPILYNAVAVEKESPNSNNYNIYNYGFDIRNTFNTTITPLENCYLEGTLSNNIFTITDKVFVSNGQTTNGKYYILLGMATNNYYIRFNSFEGKIVYKCTDSNHTLIPVSNWNTVENKPTIPTGSSTATDIQMNGTQSAGTSNQFAKANHVHPTDTSRAAATHTHPDTQITWNGTNTQNSVSPLDMAMYEEFNPNRLAYFPGENITIEYSTDGGSTWTKDTTTANNNKLKLVTTSFNIQNSSTVDYSKNQLRITLKVGDIGETAHIYMISRKLMLYLCTCGATNPKVTISYSTYASPTNFQPWGTYNVSGWSGWNSIPFNRNIGCYDTQATNTQTNVQNIRLTFTQTGGTGNIRVSKIRLFGETCYVWPSNLANIGHIYNYDDAQNATFPGKIIKSGGTSSQFLKADGSVDSNTYLTTSNANTTYQPKGNYYLESNINGGKNLIPNSQEFANVSTGVLTGEYYQDCAIRRCNNTNGSDYIDYSYDNIPHTGEFKQGDKITLSFWAKGTGRITCYNYGYSGYITSKVIKSNGSPVGTSYGDGGCNITLTDTWTRYYVTWELNPSAPDSSLDVIKRTCIRTQVGTVSYICGVMLERGEVAHDWSPAPLDARTPKFNQITASASNIVDLNDYKTGGFYYTNHDTNYAPYIIHTPWSNGTATPYTGNRSFFLLVETWGTTSTYVKQTLTYYNGNNTYVRTCNAGTWTNWKELNTNNNDYLRVATRIIAGEPIDANKIIGGCTDNKYYAIVSGKVLDTKYPILFNTTAITSGSYTDNTYISHTGVPLTNNVSGITTITSQKQVYIEGVSYDGRQFTVSDRVFISDDKLNSTNDLGKYYIYIGASYSTTNIRFNSFHQTVYIMTRNGLVPVGDNPHNPHMLQKSDAGTVGFFKFLTINTKGTYHDQTIEFDVTHRGNKPKTVVSFNFNTYEKTIGSRTYYINLQGFYYHGHPTSIFCIQTKDDIQDATFDFYIQRASWDEMGVSDLRSSVNNYNNMTVTWHNEFVTTLPDGTTQATLNPYYTPTNHTHDTLSIDTTTIVSGSDLNTITDRGWYECANIAHTNISNTPRSGTDFTVNSFSYFTMNVEGGTNANLRTQMLYTFPSGSADSQIFYRKMYKDNNIYKWTSWKKIV